MTERIYRTNLDLRSIDLTLLNKFDKLEETPAIGTRIKLREITLEVCDVTYRYIDAFLYEIVVEVNVPRGRSVSDFMKLYEETS